MFSRLSIRSDQKADLDVFTAIASVHKPSLENRKADIINSFKQAISATETHSLLPVIFNIESSTELKTFIDPLHHDGHVLSPYNVFRYVLNAIEKLYGPNGENRK